MSRSHTQKNMVHVSTVFLSSFAGMILAVPLAFAIGNPANTAEAQNAGSSAVSSQEDLAKFAYAFNQGYEAKAASMVTGAGTCTEASVSTPGEGSASAVSAVSHHGSGAVATSASTMHSGKGSWKHPAKHHSPSEHKKWESIVNSYNTYKSTVHNTNTTNVTNTNSNNTIGSHNTTSTEVKVDDSKGVIIGVSNESTATQNAANESFNHDSYNNTTNNTTNTTTISDSFNKETNTAINSGNTMNKVTNETKVIDSYNTENNTTTNTTNTTINESFNDNKMKVELESPAYPVITKDEV